MHYRNTRLYFKFSALSIALILLELVQPSTQCPDYVNAKIEYCVQPVVEYAKVLNQHENNSTTTDPNNLKSRSQFGKALQLPKLGGQVFRDLCRLIREFDHCVEAYKPLCPKHITINLIDSSYGYLCTEGFDTFMASAECLMALDQKPAVKHCHDQTLTDIETANAESTLRMDSKLSRMCSALNYFAACVRPHIWQSCGVDAWHVIFRVLKDTTRTLMPSCVFSGESAKLEAEQRQNEADQEEQIENSMQDPASMLSSSSYESRIANYAAANTLKKSTSTARTNLAIQSVYSSAEREAQMSASRSLEEDSKFTDQEQLDRRQPKDTQQLQSVEDDRPTLSFEIHEVDLSDRGGGGGASAPQFGTWSSAAASFAPSTQRSQYFSINLLLAFLVSFWSVGRMMLIV